MLCWFCRSVLGRNVRVTKPNVLWICKVLLHYNIATFTHQTCNYLKDIFHQPLSSGIGDGTVPFYYQLFHPCVWNQGKADSSVSARAALTLQSNQTDKTPHTNIHPVVWNLHSISRLTDWKNNITNFWMKVYSELLILSCLTGAALILHPQACIGAESILLPFWDMALSSVFHPKREQKYLLNICVSFAFQLTCKIFHIAVDQ